MSNQHLLYKRWAKKQLLAAKEAIECALENLDSSEDSEDAESMAEEAKVILENYLNPDTND